MCLRPLCHSATLTLENSPRNTGEDLSDLESNDVLGSEEDGDETAEEDEAGDDSVPIAETLRDITVDEETNNLSDGGTVGQTGLPSGGHLVLAILVELAVLLVELGEGLGVCQLMCFTLFPK
jgi:hypothetical protein